jgi:hypothetical protein
VTALIAPPEGWHWRYLPRHRCLHALSEPENRMARCGADERGRGWRGEGSQAERDYAAMLPLCSSCMRCIDADGAR